MKGYSIAITTVLFAASWIGPSSKSCVVQQPGAEANSAQKDQSKPADQNQSQALPGNTNQGQLGGTSASAAKAAFILADFTESLNAKKLKPGDTVKAEVSQDVLAHGKIVIPAGSKLIGHITEAKGHETDDPESRLGIVFDKILLKHHQEIDFLGVVQALEPPAPRTSRVDQPDQMMPPAIMGVTSVQGSSPMGTGMPGAKGSTATGPTGAGVPMSATNMTNMPTGAPTFINGTPGSNPGNTSGADINRPASMRPVEQRPMSVGMPQGVFGLKGLSLTSGATGNTPGPVIVSLTRDVKLDYGTQILLRVTGVSVSHP